MLNIVSIFEQRRQAATSSAEERRQFALQRIMDLKAALARGAIDQKTYQARLAYWRRVAAGAAVSPQAAQAGLGPSVQDLKTAGTYF